MNIVSKHSHCYKFIPLHSAFFESKMSVHSNKCAKMSRTQQFTFYKNIVIKISKKPKGIF